MYVNYKGDKPGKQVCEGNETNETDQSQRILLSYYVLQKRFPFKAV